MSLLRILLPAGNSPPAYPWSLSNGVSQTSQGESPLDRIPRGARRIHLILPAGQVRITRVRLPVGARRGGGSVLAFAVEDHTAGEPDTVSVSWLGTDGDGVDATDVLAVTDKAALVRGLDALGAAGLGAAEVHCECLLLPWSVGHWTLAWDGGQGIVRTGALEGTATDCGDALAPPLCLRLMLNEAGARNARPASIVVHVAEGGDPPDPAAWQQALGVPIRLLGPWTWRSSPPGTGVALNIPSGWWRISPASWPRLRAAAYIATAAVFLHAIGVTADWRRLAGEHAALQNSMMARFHATFPDAVAAVDPALQMRRKLAEARHAAGIADGGDFLPLFEQVAAAAKELGAGPPRSVAYENARLTLEYRIADESAVRRVMTRLLDAGLAVELIPAGSRLPATGTFVLTVRPA